MDVEILARIQFALTIMFHYIYPPLSIGLGLIMVIVEAIYLKTKDPFYKEMAKFWTKIFALTFAIGVATGIVMEFEFGTNWSAYSRYVGDVFGSALAAEGVFAFFLESGFLAILLFGWDRVGPKLHFFATLMVCLGAHFSAIWIVVANSWMQTPAGFEVVGEGLSAKAHIISFWGMVFNPSSVDRLIHVVIGAWLAGAFLVSSIAAYYLLKNRHLDFAKSSLKISLTVGLVCLILQFFSGDSSGRIVARYQPAKLAALEGIYQTQKGVGLALFGIPNPEKGTLDYSIKIPHLLSFLVHRDFNGEITGLDQFPKKDWPSSTVFHTYHLMILMWGIMLVISLISAYQWRKQTLFTSRATLWALVFAVLCPQIANQAGWISAEMGRYPWIVYNLLRISEGLSKSVTANQILGSIIMFTILYFFLFLLFLYLLNEKIQAGPKEIDRSDAIFQQHLQYVKEIKHEPFE